MRLFAILFVLLMIKPCFASECRVGCTYISEHGIMAGACSTNKVQALAQAQINCLKNLKSLFREDYSTIAPQAMSMCEVPNGTEIKLKSIHCDYYKNKYYFEDEFLAQSCSMPQELKILGVTVYRSKSDCE